MRPAVNDGQVVSINMVGPTRFGRYPVISDEQTFNMLISLNGDKKWFVNSSGYKKVLTISDSGISRGIHVSEKFNRIITVIDDRVFAIDPFLNYSLIGQLETFSGDVFFAESNTNQIGICDKKDIWIYTWTLGTFTKAEKSPGIALGFIPGYLEFQNGYFITTDITEATVNTTNISYWYISKPGDGTQFPGDSQTTGEIGVKGTYALACVRVPSKGNLLYVMGKSITQLWNLTGSDLFPYQLLSTQNFEYGCLNPNTIASSADYVCWLGFNEVSGPVLMVASGGEIQQLVSEQDDGINFRISHLNFPERSVGMFYRQDGHLIYQITFYDPQDNLTLLYDFETKMFFTATDENMNYHIARKVVFFNNKYYFISFIDGDIYEMSSLYTTYDYGEFNFDGSPKVYEIPRVRVCPTFRLDDNSPFSIPLLNIIMEQGIDPKNYQEPDYTPRIDFSMSKNNGQSFSNARGYPINPIGKYANRININNLGRANSFTPQFRFWGKDRFTITDSTMVIRQ